MKIGKNVTDIQPRKFQVIKFAAEIFDARPDDWNQPRGFDFAPAPDAAADNLREQPEPKRKNHPKHDCRFAKDVPEEKQLRRGAEKSRRQPEIKRAADGWLVSQPDETAG